VDGVRDGHALCVEIWGSMWIEANNCILFSSWLNVQARSLALSFCAAWGPLGWTSALARHPTNRRHRRIGRLRMDNDGTQQCSSFCFPAVVLFFFQIKMKGFWYNDYSLM
jgi:hypothetical protein